MKEAIIDTWHDLIAFIKNPEDRERPEQDLKSKAKRLFSVLAIELPVMAILVALMQGIEQLGLFNSEDHKVEDLFEMLSPLNLLLVAGVGLPFIEELIFRFSLRLKRNYPIQLIISIATFLTEKDIRLYLEEKWHRYYKYLFYSSAIGFALVHIFNFELSLSVLLVAPILIAPQFLMGLFMGYLRMKCGFIWGFFLHAIHNTILIGLALVFLKEMI